jgi:transposase InsO family protein
VSDAELAGMIVQIHDRSRCTYGAPRVHAELARLGWRCGRKRVARLMRSQQLVGVHARRRWRRGRPDAAAAPDLVQRNFNPAGPDRLWAADVTQFRTGEGSLHLAAVIDLWSRRVVGSAMGTTANAELVSDALVMAFQRRRPDRRVVHHSDRGAAGGFTWSSQHLEPEVLRHGVQASSCAGDPGDAGEDVVPWPAFDGAARGSGSVLGGDCPGPIDR